MSTQNLLIEGTPKTPTITFEPETGLLEIKGRSIPENSTEFYRPLCEILKKTPDNSSVALTVNFQLEYFNTSSSKCILDILKILALIKKSGTEVLINWYYEEDDEDMLESGENYQEIVNIPFKMIVLPQG
jgi:hypothetical protein